MDILSVLVVFLAEFLIGLFGAKWAFSVAGKMGIDDGEGFSLPLGIVLLLASFVCVSLVLGNGFGGSNTFFLYAVIAMGLVVMVLRDMRLSAVSYTLGLLGVCWVCSYFLPTELPIATGFSGALSHIGLAVAWVVLTWLFVQMDRVPFLSMIMSLVFAIFYFLLSGFLKQFEPALGYLSITLVVVLLGMNSYLKKGHNPQLGQVATTFLGFIWAAMAVYVLASGHKTAIVILYSYPIMEVILSTVASVAIYQRFMPVYPFLIEQVLISKPHSEKALKFIMRWEFLMACFAVLVVLNKTVSVGAFYIAIALFSIHIYMRLKSWGVPPVRLRDVFKDVKEGIGYIKEEVKTIAKNKKLKKQMLSDKKITPKAVVVEKSKTSVRKKTMKKTSEPKKKRNSSVKKSPKTKKVG